MKTYLCFFLLFGISLISTLSEAQIIDISFSENFNSTAEQYQVHDITFRGNSKNEQNPFEVIFGAVYTGPQGQRMNIPGFFNGNGEWISRFSASEKGTWSFETYGSMSELSGHTGQIEIKENTRSNQKGAVIIDPQNPQAFVYEDGSSHFLLAYELDWLYALDYESKEGLPRTNRILDDVAANGFNHVVMNLYAYDVGWGIAKDVPEEYFFGKPDYGIFEGGNENPDFSRLNLKLFQHLDRVFSAMQEKGLDAHLMIYVWNKMVNWPEMYSKADNMYFDYLIDRYQAFSNVIWDISKEALDYGRCDIPYLHERISRVRARDAFKRLLTVHDYEYNSRHEDKVDFVSIQSWRPNLYSLMLQGRQLHSKPVVNIEHGGYEEGPFISFLGNYTNAETCLERTYECVFAGVYGSYYWQDAAWNIVVWDALDDKHDFDKPRYDYYKHMSGLFGKLDFNDFKPSVPKLTTNDKGGNDNLATNGYGMYDGKGKYLMLIPKETERTNVIITKPESGKVKITWMNPFTGEYQDNGEMDWSGWMEVISPWQYAMSVLIIESI
ncbi:DUF5060 domain-containing protein [Mongoliibacter ruber]|uniref:Uncharacterized protein DUF5060 n=1 Tax=Mongoliibacter ruber TaxID=1750599 RepID=A0A2T0WJK8_9BACT|nr:DUF5060 domain-containing protein [Mongoliibacter ruber]PRY86714.1 uncharacterized protein DUF5060 [Mongoliibacter ruber]